MPTRASKLLLKMRKSAIGWTRSDLEVLYRGFGFEIRTGGSHDIATHYKYRDLRGTLPNHKDFAQAYVHDAVKLVTEALNRDAQQGV